MKKILAFWLRFVTFALALVILLNYAVYVLVPKKDYGICVITNFYNQPEESIDVLVLGTSCGYAGINTATMWDEYGIAVYTLCSAQQPYWITYYYLVEALKTQTPKLILIDAKASMYGDDYLTLARTINSTYGIRNPLVRLKAIAASVAPEDVQDLVLAFPRLHDNYKDLTAEYFVYPPDNGDRGPNWKGHIEVDATEQHERPSLVWTDTKKPINAREEEYFRKTLALANEHDIPVMLVGFPNPDYAYDHMYYNSLWAIAEEYGVTGINYNDPDLWSGLRSKYDDPKLQTRLSYSSNFADWQHLNIGGSIIFTRRLGYDIKQLYDLPDRRGDDNYVTWQLCMEEWYAKYPDYAPGEETGEDKEV